MKWTNRDMIVRRPLAVGPLHAENFSVRNYLKAVKQLCSVYLKKDSVAPLVADPRILPLLNLSPDLLNTKNPAYGRLDD